MNNENSVIVNKIIKSFPKYNFKIGNRSLFRPPNTIYYDPKEENYHLVILHEIGHATLGHRRYSSDVELLKMERAAWEEAKKIADKLQIDYKDDFIEKYLDSYRDYLHQKSSCPNCGLTRFQPDEEDYLCPICDCLK